MLVSPKRDFLEVTIFEALNKAALALSMFMVCNVLVAARDSVMERSRAVLSRLSWNDRSIHLESA